MRLRCLFRFMVIDDQTTIWYVIEFGLFFSHFLIQNHFNRDINLEIEVHENHVILI